MGYKLFLESKFKVLKSTTVDCQRWFALAKKSQEFAFSDVYSDDQLPKWIKEKIDDADKDLDLEEKNEFESNQELLEDFLSKLILKKVNNVEEYYSIA